MVLVSQFVFLMDTYVYPFSNMLILVFLSEILLLLLLYVVLKLFSCIPCNFFLVGSL